MSDLHDKALADLESLRLALREMRMRDPAKEYRLEDMFARSLNTIGQTIRHHAQMEILEEQGALVERRSGG